VARGGPTSPTRVEIPRPDVAGSAARAASAPARLPRRPPRPRVRPAPWHTSATVGEYLEQWLANQEPTARKTTFGGYKSDLDRVIRCLGPVRLHELTPMRLETAYAETMKSRSARGGALSAKTVYNAHSSL